MAQRLTPVEIMERLVGFPTVSRDSNLPLVDWVEDYLRENGIAAHRHYDETLEKAAIFAHVAALSVLSLGPLFFGYGVIYGVFAGVSGAVFLIASWRLLRDPSRAHCKATFHASLLHFALLSLGVILDRGAAAWFG